MGNPLARMPRHLGKLLFGVWLLLMGLFAVLDIRGAGVHVVLGIVLIGSGVCFILGR